MRMSTLHLIWYHIMYLMHTCRVLDCESILFWSFEIAKRSLCCCFYLHYTTRILAMVLWLRGERCQEAVVSPLHLLFSLANFFDVDMPLALYGPSFGIEKNSTVHYIAYLISVYPTFSLSLNIQYSKWSGFNWKCCTEVQHESKGGRSSLYT